VADEQSHVPSLIAAAVESESSESKFFSVNFDMPPMGNSS